MAYASQQASSMKLFPLGLAGLVVGMGLLTSGCGSEPDEASAPPSEPEVTRVASSLERKLTAPIAVPKDTPIGASIDALIASREGLVANDPVGNLGPNGKRCTTQRFDDDKGVMQLLRDQCDGTDILRVGKLVYTDRNGDGKVDQFVDSSASTYELHDDDHDGRIDRMLESAERMKTPILLAEFGNSVIITGGGKIATRELADEDRDGKFDRETVTATTSFQMRTPAGTTTAK